MDFERVLATGAGGAQPAAGGPVWHQVDPRGRARAFRCALEAGRGRHPRGAAAEDHHVEALPG